MPYKDKTTASLRKKAYYKKHRKELLEQKKVYYQENKQRIKAYLIKNKKRISIYSKSYRKKNKQHLLEYGRKYHQQNFYRKKRNLHLWLANQKNKCGDITINQIKAIYLRDKICVYCKSKLNLTLDHIIPLSQNNGNSTFYNYVISCVGCNISKSNLNVVDWCKKKDINIPPIITQNLNKLRGL